MEWSIAEQSGTKAQLERRNRVTTEEPRTKPKGSSELKESPEWSGAERRLGSLLRSMATTAERTTTRASSEL